MATNKQMFKFPKRSTAGDRRFDRILLANMLVRGLKEDRNATEAIVKVIQNNDVFEKPSTQNNLKEYTVCGLLIQVKMKPISADRHFEAPLYVTIIASNEEAITIAKPNLVMKIKSEINNRINKMAQIKSDIENAQSLFSSMVYEQRQK